MVEHQLIVFPVYVMLLSLPLKSDVFAQTSSSPVQRLTVISFPAENPLHLE